MFPTAVMFIRDADVHHYFFTIIPGWGQIFLDTP